MIHNFATAIIRELSGSKVSLSHFVCLYKCKGTGTSPVLTVCQKVTGGHKSLT